MREPTITCGMIVLFVEGCFPSFGGRGGSTDKEMDYFSSMAFCARVGPHDLVTIRNCHPVDGRTKNNCQFFLQEMGASETVTFNFNVLISEISVPLI